MCRTIDPVVRSCDFKGACDFVEARESGEWTLGKAQYRTSQLENQIPQIEIRPKFVWELFHGDPEERFAGIVYSDLLRQSSWFRLSQ